MDKSMSLSKPACVYLCAFVCGCCWCMCALSEFTVYGRQPVFLYTWSVRLCWSGPHLQAGLNIKTWVVAQHAYFNTVLVWMKEVVHDWLLHKNKLIYYHLKIHELHALTWYLAGAINRSALTQTHIFVTHTNTQEEKYTQMVAQETICFCWLSPRPLIKHGVAETFFPVELVSKQSCALNNTDMNLSISPLFHQLCAPGIGSCWVLPHTLQGWRHVHFLINWILKWPCGDIDLHLMKAAQWHTWKDTRTSILPCTSFTSSRLAEYHG